MQIVAIRDMSTGNETVGEVWQETKIFDGDTPISEIVRWAASYGAHNEHTWKTLNKKLTITLPHGEVI